MSGGKIVGRYRLHTEGLVELKEETHIYIEKACEFIMGALPGYDKQALYREHEVDFYRILRRADEKLRSTAQKF